MATRKRTARAAADDNGAVEMAHLPDPDDAPPPYLIAAPTATEERRERELEDVLSEIGNDARIKVYQVIDGRATYAGDVSAEGFSLDTLLDAFGGGEKSLTIMQGKHIREKVKVWLDPSIPPKNPKAPKGAAPGVAPGASDMSAILTAAATSQMSMMQMMQGMMSMSQQSTSAMVNAMATMLAASNAGKTDPTELAVKLATLFKGDGGGGSTEVLLNMFHKGVDLGERIGGKNDDDGVVGVVKEGMSMLGTLVDGIVTERKAAALRASQGLPALPAGVVGTVAGQAPAETLTNTPPMTTQNARPWVAAALPHMAKLISAASFLTPGAAADTLAHRLSDDAFDDLLDDIHDQNDGGFGVRIKSYFPDVVTIDPHWLGEVVRILLTDYVDESDDTAETTTTDNGQTQGAI